jgi:peptide/nickel transport system substrate-binding protein
MLQTGSNRTFISVTLLFTLTVVLLSCGRIGGQPTASPDSGTQPETGSAGQLPELPEVLTSLSEEERQQTVIWDMNSGPVASEYLTIWNPLHRNARREKGLHQAMVEPLFILNYESGAIEPWLATDMTANATLDVWTMTLRDGVTWSDGEAFNADDVVFTSQLILDNPELELDFAAGFIELVERVEKVDDLTVRYTLSRPNPRFQLDYFSVKIWGSFAIVPEHIWKDKDPLTFTNYDPDKGWPVFTGPYLLERFDESVFVYVRDDAWWGAETGFKPLPEPQRLIWYALEDDAQRIALAQEGWLDSISNISLANFEALRETNPNTIAWFDGLPYAWIDPCSRLLSLNHMVEPWGESEMRRAVNYAIDRDAIVEQVYQGTTLPSRHFFPAYPPLERYVNLLDDAGLYDTYPMLQHDPAQAQQLIEAQGWRQNTEGAYTKAGTPLELTIYAHASSESMQRVGKVIAEQLQAVGIDATSEALNDNIWVEYKRVGDFEALIDWDACGSINEPWAAMDRYHARWSKPLGEPVSNYNNQIRWENAEYSALVDEMAVLPLGDPRVDDLFVAAMEIWLAELPFLPIAQEKQLIPFTTTYWRGWPTAQNSYIHPPTWWQSAHIILHHLEPTSPQ